MSEQFLKEKKILQQKIKNTQISEKYKSFSEKKANELKNCAKYLWFDLKMHIETGEERLKLQRTYTCKDRFCPFCNWRRSLKYSAIIFKFLESLEDDYKYIFLTLTTKNCRVENLRQTIQDMNKSFRNMTRKKNKYNEKWINSIQGYIKILEITVNKKDKSINPHFHILLAVEPDYFDKTNQNYITQKEFTDMWKNALQVDYTPIVDIRVVKNKNRDDTNMNSVVAEMFKYPLKDVDLKILKNDVFKTFTEQMRGLRQFSTGGVFKGATSQIENIDSDLININELDEIENSLWIVLIQDILYTFEKNQYILRDTGKKPEPQEKKQIEIPEIFL